jgi:outer membrane protein assembly factor BamB
VQGVRGGCAAALAAICVALAVPSVAGGDWSTYGYSGSRSALNPSEHTLSPENVGGLHELWSTDLGATINAQPVLASGVRLESGRHADLVYAGTEKGNFAAVDAGTGEVVWSRDLGAPRSPSCREGYGVTDTAVLDRQRGSVYVVGGDGVARELDLATGETKRRWTILTDTNHEHVWSGLSLVGGILYVPVAGTCDTTPYHGRVVAVSTSTGNVVATWWVTGRHSPGGGGIWGWGGVAIDRRKNAIYAATGNSTDSSEHAPYGERVVRLDLMLHVRASHHPTLPLGDDDFGATPLLYQVKGCPRQLAVGAKMGQFYVYDRDRIGRGPVQKIKLGGDASGDNSLLGNAAAWPAKRLIYVVNPANSGGYEPGMLAFRVNSRCRLVLAWQRAESRRLASSPTVANGVVYYATGWSDKVVAFDASTGERLWSSGSALGGHDFNSPSVIDGVVYTGDWGGRLHAFGLP